MKTSVRFAAATAILASGLALGAVAGFPAEDFRWESLSQAYEDSVVVTRAEYDPDDNELRVRAESTSPTAVLSVYTLDGQLIGVLERDDATRHEGRFTVEPNPRVITVRSSAGGEATVLVTGDNPPTVTPSASPSATASAVYTGTPSPTVTGQPTDGLTPTDVVTPGSTDTPPPSATTVTPGSETVTPTSTNVTPSERILMPLVLNRAPLRP